MFISGIICYVAFDFFSHSLLLEGLCAAKKLESYDQKVLVLEARDRVGGRTYTIKVCRFIRSSVFIWCIKNITMGESNTFLRPIHCTGTYNSQSFYIKPTHD